MQHLQCCPNRNEKASVPVSCAPCAAETLPIRKKWMAPNLNRGQKEHLATPSLRKPRPPTRHPHAPRYRPTVLRPAVLRGGAAAPPPRSMSAGTSFQPATTRVPGCGG